MYNKIGYNPIGAGEINTTRINNGLKILKKEKKKSHTHTHQQQSCDQFIAPSCAAGKPSTDRERQDALHSGEGYQQLHRDLLVLEESEKILPLQGLLHKHSLSSQSPCE